MLTLNRFTWLLALLVSALFIGRADAQLAGVGNLTPCPAGSLPNSTGTVNNCTAVAQKFVGTAPPGSVAGNLPGDTFSDTTNHKTYWCNAVSGSAAPACTSVTTGGWTLANTSSAVTPVGLTYVPSGSTTFDAGSVSAGIGTVTLTHSTTTTLLPSNLISGGSYDVIMSQDSSGGGVPVSLGTTAGGCTVWQPATITTSTAPSSADILHFMDSGGTCYATLTSFSTASQAFSFAVTWAGMTFAGGISTGQGTTGMWIPSRTWGASVEPDGTILTIRDWDENGCEWCVFKDGLMVRPAPVGTDGFLNTHNGGGWDVGGIVGSGDIVWGTRLNGQIGRTSLTTRDLSGGTGAWVAVATGPIGGLALNTGANELYATSRTDNRVYVLNATTMLAVRNFAFTAPGQIAVDANGNLWIVRTSDNKVYRYSAAGAALGNSITLPNSGVPLALALDVNTGRLMVGDNGANQQVLFYNNLTANPPTLQSTFGTTGGIYSGTAGVDGPLKLTGPVGLGTDSGGNIFVISERGGSSIRKFTSAGALVWEIRGGEFVGAGVPDPVTDAVDIYSMKNHYKMNYNLSAGSEWSHYATTINHLANTNDPRISGPAHEGFGGIQGMQTINGIKYLLQTDQYDSYVFGYRMSGEIAVPSFIIMPSDKVTGSGWTPVGGAAPTSQGWAWHDSNGNGLIEASEIYDIAGEECCPRGWWMDGVGNLWSGWGNNTVRLYTMQGLDGANNPIYLRSAMTNNATGTNFTEIARPRYDTATGTMYMSGYTAANPNCNCGESLKNAGTTFEVIPNWNTGNRTPSKTILLPYSDPANFFAITTWAIAGNRLFAAVQNDHNPPHSVYEYNMDTGAFIGDLYPNAIVGNGTGDYDGGAQLYATQRANGQYIVVGQEEVWQRLMIYRTQGQ